MGIIDAHFPTLLNISFTPPILLCLGWKSSSTPGRQGRFSPYQNDLQLISVQTPTSQPWTTGYTTSTPQTSFVPMTVYNYASNQFGKTVLVGNNWLCNLKIIGQNMSAGNMFQSNGTQQQQTIK